jgi:hypothetical protein
MTLGIPALAATVPAGIEIFKSIHQPSEMRWADWAILAAGAGTALWCLGWLVAKRFCLTGRTQIADVSLNGISSQSQEMVLRIFREMSALNGKLDAALKATHPAGLQIQDALETVSLESAMPNEQSTNVLISQIQSKLTQLSTRLSQFKDDAAQKQSTIESKESELRRLREAPGQNTGLIQQKEAENAELRRQLEDISGKVGALERQLKSTEAPGVNAAVASPGGVDVTDLLLRLGQIKNTASAPGTPTK